MATLRWILVPFVGVAAWFAAVFSIYVFDGVYWKFDYPCPREQITSGSCPNASFDWYDGYIEVLMSIGAGLAAIYVVVACTLVAPTHKSRVALVTYVIGAVISIVAGWSIPAAMLAALLAGGGAAAAMQRRFPGGVAA